MESDRQQTSLRLVRICECREGRRLEGAEMKVAVREMEQS
jgi:hypothetical protein